MFRFTGAKDTVCSGLGLPPALGRKVLAVGGGRLQPTGRFSRVPRSSNLRLRARRRETERAGVSLAEPRPSFIPTWGPLKRAPKIPHLEYI